LFLDCSDCGDDGCGGSCGTCGADETCSSAQVCISTNPFIPQAPVTYATDSKGLAGSFFGGVFASMACAGGIWFFGMGGRAKFDKWRYGVAENDPDGDAKVLIAKESGNKKGGNTATASSSSSAANERQALSFYKSPISPSSGSSGAASSGPKFGSYGT
jgi:hypothetical protein